MAHFLSLSSNRCKISVFHSISLPAYCNLSIFFVSLNSTFGLPLLPLVVLVHIYRIASPVLRCSSSKSIIWLAAPERVTFAIQRSVSQPCDRQESDYTGKKGRKVAYYQFTPLFGSTIFNSHMDSSDI